MPIQVATIDMVFLFLLLFTVAYLLSHHPLIAKRQAVGCCVAVFPF